MWCCKTFGTPCRWPQMTSGGSPMKTVAWVITEGPKPTPFRVNGNVPLWKRGSWNFAHWLKVNMSRSRNWPDLRATNIKNPRYTSCSNYWPHQFLKVWKHWVQDCDCGRVSKLLNCVLRWRHLTWPGDLTWYDLGSKFLHKMRKGWMNSYAKFGGAARCHFPAICDKPMGTHMFPRPCAG